MSPPVTIRSGAREDWDFIREAWRSTFTFAPAVQGADKASYFDEMSRLFSSIVPKAEARLACDPTDDDNRLAFAVFTGPDLHFIYVYKEFRHMGIVPALLDGVPIKRYNFSTPQGVRRLKPVERGWVFAPRFTFGT